MNASRRSKKISFLKDYKMAEDTFLEPNDQSGRPGIWPGIDPEGRNILVKFWPRLNQSDDRDLEEIWRSEIRQLHTLAALPEANDLIVKMVASGRDSSGFYLILDVGDGTPLEPLRSIKNPPQLLVTSRLPRSRLILWQNFRRLIRAIDLLHSLGTIHRNIDPWSIISNFTSEPDFRLTGFEWSMRIAATTTGKRKPRDAPRKRPTSSFSGDWYDLALVIALILDIPAARLIDMNIVPSAVADHASASEVRILRTMLGLLHVSHLDSDELLRQVDEITRQFGAEMAGKEAKLHIAFRLGDQSKITRKIRAASNFGIETSEINDQIKFVVSDLGETPILITCKAEIGDTITYLLCGQHLSYRLRPYKSPGSATDETWDFATCDDAETEPTLPWLIDSSTELSSATIEISERHEAHALYPRLRGKVLSWETLIRKSKGITARKSPVELVHQAMSLLLLLELAYAAADIFPVTVAHLDKSTAIVDVFSIEVADILDADRIKLSEALELDPPAIRLRRLMEIDEYKEEGAWSLLEAGELGERVDSTNWRVVRAPAEDSQGWFILEGFQPPQTSGRAFLTPANTAGTIVQLRRRLKALSALFRHKELLEMLADPRGRIESSQDPLDKSASEFLSLDESKQKALAEILDTVPLFLLQGPPGVGKTFLTADIVRRRFADDGASRLLLSAQSNSALDHLMGEVQNLFAESTDAPLIVRARSADNSKGFGGFEIDAQASKVVAELASSNLLREGTDTVQDRVRSLALDIQGSSTSSIAKQRRRSRTSSDRRAIESMILRSANLVFATTNSAAIETLIEERGYFDWVIVEEAGKATGSELISPLLLSYRRLMIGDHKQLPPFDIEKISKLLAVPSKVQKAITSSSDLISRYMRDSLLDEAVDEIEANLENLGRTCADALSYLKMFETLVESDFKKLVERPLLKPIARRLNEQHRMHPAIAKIVSRCFYDGELTTSHAIAKKFNGSPPVLFEPGGAFSDIPITFVDLPYCRKAPAQGDFSDSEPFWSNSEEAKSTMRVLRSLRQDPSFEQPVSLALLSPYREQVKLLRKTLSSRLNEDLTHIQNFRPAVSEQEYCGTVDSFQGGEADCVVISLVRNNAHTNPLKALGFLTKSHRMNVLLSRAKWKMILIGSLDFYKHIIDSSQTGFGEMKYFKEFYTALVDGVATNEVGIVRHEQL